MNINFLELLALLGLPSAVTGFCFWWLKGYIDKKEKVQEEQEATRLKNEVLLVKSIGASIALGEATAIAIKNGKCNGETEAALEYAQRIKHEQRDFLHEQGIKNIYKED